MKQEWIDQINKLKKEQNAKILAHTYQPAEILDVADLTGDSFKLSAQAEKLDCEVVILCGVRFMAETVKILSPQKKVVLASAQATCPMAEQIAPARVAAFKKEHPEVAVCAYINTTAQLKAECDICVTSSSAVKIVGALEQDRILFIPDKNLGAYVQQQLPQKEILLWDGFCPVHNAVAPEDILEAKRAHPDALVAMHPECPPQTLALADMAGSTSAIIQYALESDRDVIIATERGVSEYLNLHHPDRHFYQPCPNKLTCPDMKMTTLQELLAALEGKGGAVIELDESLRLSAKKSIDRMLAYGG